MAGPYLRKYGEAATIDFELFEVDGVDFRVDAVHAAGDTVIMRDEGAEANTTNGFTDEGNGYSIVLDATEMSAARIVVYIIDQTATKVWLDRTLIIETYGHVSAQHAFDLDTALTPSAIADQVWDEAKSGHVVAGSFGEEEQAHALSSEITALNDLSASNVNTEVSDVLKTDTIAEMAQQAPPTTPTFQEAVMYLYMALTHRIDITATLKEFHNNAGTVIWKKTLSDDSTTYTEAESVSGP